MDVSSTKQGSGVMILLVMPLGEELRVVVQLSFKTSNNETEYKALLESLHAVKHVGATRVILHSNS